jgi:hypothetical protein
MRSLTALAAGVVAAIAMLCGMPTGSRADVMPSTRKPGCHCPQPAVRHHVVHRYVHYRAHRRRYLPEPPMAFATPLYWYYSNGIPSAWDPGYDRWMVLHFRNPAVSGIPIAELGYPPTPPVAEIEPYRYQAVGAVMQYDGLTGEYIQLSQFDAARAFPPQPPPPPASPAPLLQEQ